MVDGFLGRWSQRKQAVRTGRPVDPNYANWTTHPNNPMAVQAAE